MAAVTCACGDPSRPGLDHTRNVCCSTGFFTAEDMAAIQAAAAKKDTREDTTHD